MPENLHNLLKIRIFDTLKAFSVQRSAFSVHGKTKRKSWNQSNF